MESAFGFSFVPSAAASSVELPHHFVFSGVTNDATADKTGSGGAFHNISLPYDDLLEFYLSGAELVLPEQFHTEVLLTETLDDLAAFLLARYARENLRYRKCKFCGRYFGVVRNYKSEYCDRLIDGSTKTCKDSGALRLYEKRKLENPAVKEYKRSYKAHNARIRYGLMTREEFQAWSKEARQNRDRCVAGELSLEEFVAWLDSDRQ